MELEACSVEKRGKPITLPLLGRDKQSFQKIVKVIYGLKCGTRVEKAVVFLCNDPARNAIICLGEPKLTFNRLRVFDRLSGLRLTVYQPLISFGSCTVKARWAGTRFILGCRDLETCGNCFTVTPRDRLYRSLL